MVLGSAHGGVAGRARFSWEAVADPLVSGYKVHWGLASGVYTQTVDVGNATELTLAGFSVGTQYFVAITDYNSTGGESAYSSEISFIYTGGDSRQAWLSWDAVANPLVSGYKVHWGLASGAYTQTVDAGNATGIALGGFSDGVRYFAAITTYSSSGDESDYSAEVSFYYDGSNCIILMEAESGVLTAPMQVMRDSLTTWVASSPADPAAAVTLGFNVPYTADYYVWCRVLAPSATADSMFVTVDQQAELEYDVYGVPSPPAAAFMPGWTWSRIQVSPGIPRAYQLDKGSHSIRFRCPENTPLDRIVIVSNPDFVPTDSLPGSGDFVAVVGQPQGGTVTAGGTVTLAATVVATGTPSLQWSHDGVMVPVSDQTSLTLANVQAASGGSYSLAASVQAASAISQPATVTVLPVAGSAVFRVRHVAVATGGQVTFQVEGGSTSQIGVLASSDLVHWSLIATQALTSNTLTISDPGAVGSAKRFYRLADSGAP